MDTKSAPRRTNRRQLSAALMNQLVLPYLEILDTPRALTVWILLREKEHDQLVQLSVDPLKYVDPELFWKDYSATELLSKSDLLETSVDTEKVALATARSAEIRCAQTNAFFDSLFQSATNSVSLLEPANLGVLLNARKMIESLIGSSPPEDLLTFTGWTPGRTTVSYGAHISALEKFRAFPDVTPQAERLALNLVNQSPRWAQSVINADGACSLVPKLGILKIAEGNVGLVVPKNAKTGRFICYEPHLNIALQRPVGNWLSQRLRRRWNVDLSDQSINGRMARQGSISGETATIDLKSASDTISSGLVRFLLPEKWFDLLDKLRSRSTLWPGDKKFTRNAKFSSMGNGFTFELQSLIFFAISRSAGKELGIQLWPSLGNLHVYGDDIVIDSRVYDRVVNILSFCGFEVNSKKSYNAGNFRESCGTNAFAGRVVTPARVRPKQRGLSLAIALHNRIRESCIDFYGCLPRKYAQLLQWIRHQEGGPLGPSGFGDGHYHVNLDEASPVKANSIKRYHGWEGWFFRTRRPYRRSRLDGFLDGSGTLQLNRVWWLPALLTALSPKQPRELLETLISAGSFTRSTLRVLANEWPDTLVID